MQAKSALLAILAFLILCPAAQAQDEAALQASGLPIPRFVSLRADKVYVRTGPALRYPIKWVYRKEGLPVEVTQEFDGWRKIRDIDGEEGWIHHSLLSGRRTALVRADNLVTLRKDPEQLARPVAKVEPQVVAEIEACEPGWCEITAGGYTGWTERNYLWGIYENEELD